MEITEKRDGSLLVLAVSGRIDVNGSAFLEEEIKKAFSSPATRTLRLDFSAVNYISSAGIRVLLATQKHLKPNQEFSIKNPSEFCRQVFEVTGADIFLAIS